MNNISLEDFKVGVIYEYLSPAGEWKRFKCKQTTPELEPDWRLFKESDLERLRIVEYVYKLKNE